MEVKMLLLDKCREILSEIMQTPASDNFGTPPQVIYIDYGPASKRKVGYRLKRIEETYRFDGAEFKIAKVGTESQREPIDGMYFKEGHVTIGYEGNRAFLDYAVGPRYGRGFEFTIISEGEEVRLGEEKVLWVS